MDDGADHFGNQWLSIVPWPGQSFAKPGAIDQLISNLQQGNFIAIGIAGAARFQNIEFIRVNIEVERGALGQQKGGGNGCGPNGENAGFANFADAVNA
jgi:hypothetical protein